MREMRVTRLVLGFGMACLFLTAGCDNKAGSTSETTKMAPKMKMTTEIPSNITTPATVETSLGTLKFFDGLPDKATVTKVYDNLDLVRGLDVYLNTQSATSTLANIEGFKSVGGSNQAVVLYEDRVDAKTLLLTPNAQTVSLWVWLTITAPSPVFRKDGF
jgi:hypothetical protein